MKTVGVATRLEATGAAGVESKFRRVGATGQQAFKKITAASRPANKGLKLFNAATGEMRSGMEGLASRAGPVARLASALGPVGLIAGVAAGGFAVMVQRASESAREIKQAAQLANAGTEEFQEFAFAAGTVGVEQEKLADILKDVNDKMGDYIQTGGGQMIDFFENIAPKVDLTADAFANLSGPEALRAYFDALEKSGANQQQMTFYMEAFADNATKLIPLLRNGGEELDTMAARARELGVVMSDDLITQGEKAAREFRILQDVIGAQMVTAFVNSSESLITLVQSFSNNLPVIVEFVQKVGQALGLLDKPLEVQLLDLSGEFDDLVAQRNKAVEELRGLGFTGDEIKDVQEDRFTTLRLGEPGLAAGHRLAQLQLDLDQKEDEISALDTRINLLRTAREIVPAKTTKTKINTRSPPGASGGGNDRYDKLIEGSIARSDALLNEAAASSKSGAAAAELREQFRLLGEARRAGIELTPTQITQIDRLAAAFGVASEKTADMTRSQQEARSAADAMQDGVSSLVRGVEDFGDIGANTLDRFSQRLLDMSTDPVFDVIADRLSTIFSASGGGIGSILSSAAGAIFGRAGGGPVMAGMPYKINEEGDEYFVPDHSGRVIPNHALNGVGQAGNGVLEVRLSDGLQAEIIRQAGQNSLQISGQMLEKYDDGLRNRVTGIVNTPGGLD